MIEYIFKATIALVIFYAFYQTFLVKESMFRFNRFFLIFALCFSLIVPFLPIPFGFQIGENLIPESISTTVKGDRSEKVIPAQPHVWEQGERETSFQIQPETPLNWKSTIPGIYLLGLFLFLTRFMLQLIQLFRMVRNNQAIRENDCTYVLLPQKTLPFTFLYFLFMDKASFQANSIEKEILYHELTHIRQKHSWDILFVEILKIGFWFNPLLFLYKKAIQLNHEFLADAAVNAKFRDKSVYQWLLFNKISGNGGSLSISSPFNFSSTKRRLIMMGKSSSSLKANLLKSISILITGFLMVFLSSSQSFKPSKFQSANDYEQILSKAFKEGNPFELDLNKLNLPALRSAFLSLDENEKYERTEFPFFDETTFEKLLELQQAYPEVKTSILFESPPEMKGPKKEIFEEWKKTKDLALTIDDIEKEASDLKQYQPDDFALFIVRETENSGLFKKAVFHVTLMTHEYYYGKYYKSKKKIHAIEAEYPNAIKVRVDYWLKHAAENDGRYSKFVPENYEASIFHHLRIIDTFQLDLENKIISPFDSQKSFPVIIRSNDGKQVAKIFLPSI
ncbi:M56 family metallopeptidase [Pleomorphovibrio marinus]|uniref:M56 family metallopeptidase n=1 Tax=Pleomorphovibrio marinus TaxID=2164132 RepID=UPI000E0B2815|nr:M56 family metallopeptidase [Pleomorphovibrio marinus]